jgi:hypothetical protein
MKNVLFNIKSVITGSSKAVARAGSGAGAETFLMSEPEPERKKIVSAPQHCFQLWNWQDLLILNNPWGKNILDPNIVC